MNDTEWFAEHSAYLATPEWDIKRKRVLKRDAWHCQAQMDGCSGTATQVHHLSYKHWRDEPLFDLVSVCATCHERITQMDRDQRPDQSRRAKPPIVIHIEPVTDIERRLADALSKSTGSPS